MDSSASLDKFHVQFNHLPSSHLSPNPSPPPLQSPVSTAFSFAANPPPQFVLLPHPPWIHDQIRLPSLPMSSCSSSMENVILPNNTSNLDHEICVNDEQNKDSNLGCSDFQTFCSPTFSHEKYQVYPFVSSDFGTVFPPFHGIDQGNHGSMGVFDSFFTDLDGINKESVVGSEEDGLMKSNMVEIQLSSDNFWGSSITKAARSKRRIARQKSCGSRFTHLLRTSSGSSFSWSSTRSNRNLVIESPQNSELISPSKSNNNRLKFLLQKELKNSDVSSLGRIVLPKRDAEANLPSLTVKEGIQVTVRDVGSSKVWNMRYRFWPNNKSRMYVLENTGDFVKQKNLKSGDYVILYGDESNQLFISARKAACLHLGSPKGKEEDEEESNQSRAAIHGSRDNKWSSGEGEGSSDTISVSATTQIGIGVVESSNPKNHLIREESDVICFDDSSSIVDFELGELDRLPNFEDCDLSLYDDLMESFTERDGGDKLGFK